MLPRRASKTVVVMNTVKLHSTSAASIIIKVQMIGKQLELFPSVSYISMLLQCYYWLKFYFIGFLCCRKRKDEIEGEIFEILLTFTDFVTFKEMMLDYRAVSYHAFSLAFVSTVCHVWSFNVCMLFLKTWHLVDSWVWNFSASAFYLHQKRRAQTRYNGVTGHRQ